MKSASPALAPSSLMFLRLRPCCSEPERNGGASASFVSTRITTQRERGVAPDGCLGWAGWVLLSTSGQNLPFKCFPLSIDAGPAVRKSAAMTTCLNLRVCRLYEPAHYGVVSKPPRRAEGCTRPGLLTRPAPQPRGAEEGNRPPLVWARGSGSNSGKMSDVRRPPPLPFVEQMQMKR